MMCLIYILQYQKFEIEMYVVYLTGLEILQRLVNPF